jgi:hypothetical protein
VQDKIDVIAVGEAQNLDLDATLKLQLQAENPHKPKMTERPSQALVWAYNRRVDVTLLFTGQKSTQFFPADAEDAKLMFQSNWQSRHAIEKAGELMPTRAATGASTGTQQPSSESAAARCLLLIEGVASH